MNVKKVLLLVEGQTEETFVKKVLNTHLQHSMIYVEPKIIYTKKVKRGNEFKGGVPEYSKVRKQLLRLLGDTSAHCVSTMIDYYALPQTFPGKQNIKGYTSLEKVEYLENEFNNDINHRNFLPYYSLHEFEALLFSHPSTIASTMLSHASEVTLQSIRNSFSTPEDINDNPLTCPSARLRHIFSNYSKPLFGSIISSRIGLDMIRTECPHFNSWIEAIEKL